MSTFSELGLSPVRVEALAAQGFTEPTPVQREAIPLLLTGRDAWLQSQTGSGKTFAYMLPLLGRLESYELPELPPDVKGVAPLALVLVPTQELGLQVRDVAKELVAPLGWRVVALIGGANPARQAEQLKLGAQVVVGTPGRVLQFLRENKLSGRALKVLVGDEADQLFDQGNRADTEAILKATSPSRQSVFVSATSEGALGLPPFAVRYLKDPLNIRVQEELKLPPAIKHLAFIVDARDKLAMVRRLIRTYEPRGAIAFVNQTMELDDWVAKLRFHHLKVAGLHAHVKKLNRAAIMRDFKAGDLQVLLATELASRGLDLSGVSLVLNMELPTDPWHYVHRVGRTGRMGKPGTAITLVAPQEAFVLKKLEKALGITFEMPVLAEGQVRERTEADALKDARRQKAEVKKIEAKVEAKAEVKKAIAETGKAPKAPKAPKVKPLTARQVAKGKAKKARTRAEKAFRAAARGERTPAPGATEADQSPVQEEGTPQ